LPWAYRRVKGEGEEKERGAVTPLKHPWKGENYIKKSVILSQTPFVSEQDE
jgi:hypothetical protein